MNPIHLVSRLPVEQRVLRGCAYCGKHVMPEAEFLAWLWDPRVDVTCQHCGTVRTGLVVVEVPCS